MARGFREFRGRQHFSLLYVCLHVFYGVWAQDVMLPKRREQSLAGQAAANHRNAGAPPRGPYGGRWASQAEQTRGTPPPWLIHHAMLGWPALVFVLLPWSQITEGRKAAERPLPGVTVLNARPSISVPL